MTDTTHHDPDQPSVFLQAFLLDGVLPEGHASYEALAEFGASYDSTMGELNRSGLNAQRQKALNPRRRQAWRDLRNTEKRLILDLQHIQPDPTVFGDAPAESLTLPEPKHPQLQLPEPASPPKEVIVEAIGQMPTTELPDPPEIEEPPPIQLDLWQLIGETWHCEPPPRAPLPDPPSFLEFMENDQ